MSTTMQKKNQLIRSYESMGNYDVCPCSTRVYTIETTSNQNSPKRRTEVHVMLKNLSFGRTFIRATVYSQIYAQNGNSGNFKNDLAEKKGEGRSGFSQWALAHLAGSRFYQISPGAR